MHNTHPTTATFVSSTRAICGDPGGRRIKGIGAALLCVLASCAQADVPADPHDAKAREIFEKLIAFRTSEGFSQVPAMANYLADEFRAAGFPDEDIHIVPLDEKAYVVERFGSD